MPEPNRAALKGHQQRRQPDPGMVAATVLDFHSESTYLSPDRNETVEDTRQPQPQRETDWLVAHYEDMREQQSAALTSRSRAAPSRSSSRTPPDFRDRTRRTDAALFQAERTRCRARGASCLP